MSSPVTAEKRAPRLEVLRRAWHKYGLIVVGNVVFFALLYFIQYRPNSGENRAMELLSFAQREETESRLQAAESLYSKILSGYVGTPAAAIARERLPKVQALAKQQREVQPPLPAACSPGVELSEVLEVQPSRYLAELIAGHYPALNASLRDRYFRVLDGYMWVAFNRDHVPLDTLRKSPFFRAGELQQRYFALKASARLLPDWVYDDFRVKNAGFFGLHNAVIDLTVSQGSDRKQKSLRVREFLPEAEIELLQFNVAKNGGEVHVHGTIAADEGKLDWQQRL
jgi:hypothetical protein